MPGFYINDLQSNIELINLYQERCTVGQLQVPGKTIKRNTLNKFLRDKAFFKTENLAVVTDGVLLNLKELLSEFKAEDVNALISVMYEQVGEQFFSRFIGSFSGALFDEKIRAWIVWTNQVGDKPVYYSVHRGLFAVGSQVNYLIDAFHEAGIMLNLDEQAAYQMLTFGFMEGDETYAREIRRLRGGQYLKYQNGELKIKEYFMLHKHPERFRNATEGQIIEELDCVMRKASEMEYAKDEEYGYEHLSDLSGGLDARMNMWVAHMIKPRHIQFITYCKANYLDELIAKQLAAYWNDEILIKPLDDVSYLYEIDEIVFMNAGLSLYSGITGGKRMLEHINFDIYGIEHTGQLNGGIIGSYLSAIGGGKEPTGMYSERLKNRLKNSSRFEYDDHELYMLYTRGFRGVMNTQQIRANYSEAITTTTFPELMQLCFDIPVEMRVNHRLYKKWITSKYPDAAKFKWEKTGALITEKEFKRLLRRYFIKAPQKLWRIFSGRTYQKTGMNPLDYWYEQNEKLKSFMEAYEERGYQYLPDDDSKKLKEDMKWLFRTGNVNEKTMVLTVLASAKLYFGDMRNGERNS